MHLVFIINEVLLPLDIFEHVFALGKDYKVRENLGELVIKSAELWKAGLSLTYGVGPLEELIDVVQDQKVLEKGNYMRILIVN